MRISVEIDEKTLSEVIKMTGETSKGPAMAKGVTEYVKRQKAATFGKMIREGFFDYPDFFPDEEVVLNPVPCTES